MHLSMKHLKLLLLFLLPALAIGQARTATVLGEIDMGVLASYHTTLTDPQRLVLGEEYELGGYMHDMDNGGIIAVTTSYVRNGAFGTNFNMPDNGFAIGKFTTAKVRFGKLWEASSFDILASVGFGWFSGADFGDKDGLVDLVYLDPDNPVGTFTMPIGVDIQWYGFDGSINALGIKYEINGWNNYLGVGFTYLL